MKSMKRLLLALSLALVTLLAAAPAHARRLDIENFRVEILVYKDGSFDVTEIIRPRFTGAWNGIYRTIPIEYRGTGGLNYTLRLQLLSITDGDGNKLRYKVSRQRHYRKFTIWVPGARDATRTVILKYRVLNGLRFFDEHDELYWNATGDEWGVPIEASSVHVTLPSEATGLRAAAFTGSFGSREQEADISVEGTIAEFVTRRTLNIREGLTIALAFDKGAVREPTWFDRMADFLYSNWPFSLPIFTFGLMFWLWYTRGRDPRVRTVSVQYEPPAGLTPAEVGTLIDNSPDMRDITAIIVDLAVRGYLVIEEKEEKEESKWMGRSSGKEYSFHSQKTSAEWTGLLPHERDLLTELFDGGTRQSVTMSDLENSFYAALPGIKDGIFKRLMQRRYYDHRPDKVQKTYVSTGIILGFLTVWGGGFLSAYLGVSMVTFLVAGLAMGAIIAGFGIIMPARTLAGTRALEGVLGFEEFLSRVEGDRMERMVKTPEMFEKYLPYAMALQVEKKWASAFTDICREPPHWYRGYYGTHFYLYGFTSGLNSMSTRMGTVMSSSPRSSGGSGFGGGGMGGGGFGGGGGGGF